ncbi:MAG: hypothetical protein GC162_05420 [Planctomycetes bacterium]|nr:hypothetical protein [Planctomycetota bacterium]
MSMGFYFDQGPDPLPPSRPGSSEPSGAVQTLQRQVDRLEMICEAMWTLLRERTNLSDEALMAKILELDLSDGNADGKITRPAQKCPKCNRPNSRRHEMCIYCGTPLRTTPFG